MEIARNQINGLMRGVGLALIQTLPTLSVVLWITSEAFGWGFYELLGTLTDSQPIRPLWQLFRGD